MSKKRHEELCMIVKEYEEYLLGVLGLKSLEWNGEEKDIFYPAKEDNSSEE